MLIILVTLLVFLQTVASVLMALVVHEQGVLCLRLHLATFILAVKLIILHCFVFQQVLRFRSHAGL
jgi:hypothetical protein